MKTLKEELENMWSAITERITDRSCYTYEELMRDKTVFKDMFFIDEKTFYKEFRKIITIYNSMLEYRVEALKKESCYYNNISPDCISDPCDKCDDCIMINKWFGGLK